MANLASDPNVLATVVGIVALALAPLAFLLWFFYTRDKLNPEPRGLVLRIFGFGVLAFIPVFLVRQFVPLPVWLMAVVVVPVLAELAKFWVVKAGVYNHPEFDEPVDGIIFAAAAGLGFATLEVIGSMLYAYFAVARLGVPGNALAAAWPAVLSMFALRGLLSGPGHALWSSLWGYALGVAKFAPANQGSGLVRNGLVAAILSHAAFNALALESSWWLNRVGLVLVIAVLWFVVMRCLRYALALAPNPQGGSGEMTR
ncbi:MAG: PrsW family intramembrane metalloprotease [Nodosilinea sp. WJT8-NPBG4]|jgi:RsiW-degrading membrane proteinase PrsW (M82 family)|nr:PrsW family intramembrane metalloprotease [Nodosilinea sp. WJT8-NPBG4]